MESRCEFGNEPTASVKEGEFLQYLCDFVCKKKLCRMDLVVLCCVVSGWVVGLDGWSVGLSIGWL